MNTNGADDEDLGALLRAAGRREVPPEHVAAQIRAAVRTEWADVVTARRRVRQRYATFALAAGVGAMAIGAWWLRPVAAPEAAIAVASLTRADGAVDVQPEGAAWSRAAAGSETTAGTSLRTAAGARAALTWRSGASVRVDENTVLAMNADRLVLQRGAVYVDGDAARGGIAPNVETPLGRVQHLGTRYEVRFEPGTLQVSVRDGRVQVAPVAGAAARDAAVAGPGERLTVAADGGVARTAIARYGADWAWTDALAPTFAIDGRTVDEFVDWAARETGREPAYATPAARAAASNVVLRGSIDGLAPQAALDAVLATTRLRAELRDGRVVVGFRDDTAGAVR